MNPRKKAEEVIADLGISTPCEIDVNLIASYFNIIVNIKQLEGAAARLTCVDDFAAITIAASETHEPRIRFSVAHELGHFFLHKNATNLFNCSTQNMQEWSRKTIEQDANIFAANLLMPESFFKKSIKGMAPSCGAIYTIAKLFKTSITATLIRFVECTIEPCALFCVQNKLITWSYKNKNFFYYIKQNSSPIETHSFAYDCFTNKNKNAEGDVPAYAWINDRSVDPEGMIYECTFFSHAINTAYSLVWVNEDIEN